LFLKIAEFNSEIRPWSSGIIPRQRTISTYATVTSSIVVFHSQRGSGSSTVNAASCGRTTPQVNTPLNNSERVVAAEEIDVTDPTHPLFGRRFEILSVHDSPGLVGHVLVSYLGHITLRIELQATNLAPSPRPAPPATKLTSQALTELAQLAEQCEVLHAQPTQGYLGKTLPGDPDPGHRGDVLDPYGGDR